MNYVFSDEHEEHDPQFFVVRGQIRRSADQPVRARILRDAADRAGLQALEAPPAPRADLLRVHTPDYLSFLEDAQSAWRQLADAGPEVVANVHPQRYPRTYPRAIVGRAGWHMADAACPIGSRTWKAALGAAGVAVRAAALLSEGAREAYALCRPSGHHAFADMAGGFCFLNNSAIAASCLRVHHARVAILDIDVHHGNGTQAIFYQRADILTLSIHAEPLDYYPFFWGHAHERGEGAGIGANVNIPLAVGTKDRPWLGALDDAIARIRRFEPGALVLALGLDAHEADPLDGMKVTRGGFEEAAARIASLDLPVLIVQEGGYLSDELGANLEAFLNRFQAGRRS